VQRRRASPMSRPSVAKTASRTIRAAKANTAKAAAPMMNAWERKLTGAGQRIFL